MESRFLGRAGAKISPLCLGNMNFGSPDCDEAKSRQIMDLALRNGINFFDTANVYQKQHSEEILGRWLAEGTAGRRNSLVLATKVYGKVGGGENDRGLSRFHIVRACEDSLRRLRTDRIDAYLLHHPDNVPIEETVRAMDDLVRAGKVIYWGTSNYKAWQLFEATVASEKIHGTPPVVEQSPYSMINRHVENELVPYCQKYGARIMAWSPLNAGRLSGVYKKGKSVADTPRNQAEIWRKALQKNIQLIEELGGIAKELGRPLPHLAYAWLLHQPMVCSVIVGPRTIEHLSEALLAAELKLTPEILKQIDELVPPGTAPDYIGW